MKDAIHVIMWLFIGALIVLVVTHADGFAKAVSAVGGQVNNSAALLAGYPPQTTKAVTPKSAPAASFQRAA